MSRLTPFFNFHFLIITSITFSLLFRFLLVNY